MTTTYEFHPAANIFPMMTGEDYRGLVDDIREHGQKEWGATLNGKLIDGRNRYRACREVGIELEVCELEPDTDPVAYVLSKNLYRRHLTREQRNQLMLDLRAMGKTCQQIADATGVNKTTVSRVVANATTESPATIKGKDGKKYPTKRKSTRRKRNVPDPQWCVVCGTVTVAPGETRCHKCAAKPAIAPVDDEPCRICGVGIRADGDRCQRCIDAGRTEPDDDVVVAPVDQADDTVVAQFDANTKLGKACNRLIAAIRAEGKHIDKAGLQELCAIRATVETTVEKMTAALSALRAKVVKEIRKQHAGENPQE